MSKVEGRTVIFVAAVLMREVLCMLIYTETIQMTQSVSELHDASSYAC